MHIFCPEFHVSVVRKNQNESNLSLQPRERAIQTSKEKIQTVQKQPVFGRNCSYFICEQCFSEKLQQVISSIINFKYSKICLYYSLCWGVLCKKVCIVFLPNTIVFLFLLSLPSPSFLILFWRTWIIKLFCARQIQIKFHNQLSREMLSNNGNYIFQSSHSVTVPCMLRRTFNWSRTRMTFS